MKARKVNAKVAYANKRWCISNQRATTYDLLTYAKTTIASIQCILPALYPICKRNKLTKENQKRETRIKIFDLLGSAKSFVRNLFLECFDIRSRRSAGNVSLFLSRKPDEERKYACKRKNTRCCWVISHSEKVILHQFSWILIDDHLSCLRK